MFCSMPGWRYPDLATFENMQGRLFQVRCSGCGYRVVAYGYEIRAMHLSKRDAEERATDA